ncbi:tryptophan-rich sensory protein [Sporosarcina trichiuri]|uniref:tryptophan-rich sensory protein n=1 Tax=Sporosarcina trichiuri TaxID=3056445 RepID=UPI0025B405AE|nr:tryptophan-rich sensory protein [Sporosarcina sp. 0.2-SM1T-5]WJY26297.1 tryptophan-rich sensory protein [Sporosarcina sp. 0.2-SM1T-5]
MGRTRKFSRTGLIVLITYVLMILMNYLANALPLNGMTTGEVSDSYSNLFAPAGYTFAIWGLIYVLLAFHVIYQLGFFRTGERSKVRQLTERVAVWFSVSSVANALWIAAWHYGKLGLSVVLMLVILVSLIVITAMTGKTELSMKEKFFLRLPFTVYFGWITVATIADITAFLVKSDWSGWGLSDAKWTVIVLLLGVAIGILTILRTWSAPYGFVLVWAYIGIYSKHIAPDGWNEHYPGIILTVSICILLLALLSLWVLIKRRKKRNRGYSSGYSRIR